RSTASVNSAMMTEPTQPGTARVLGGESGGVAINDGRNIERSASLPTVDEVLSKYVEAMGGAAAFNAVTTRVIKGVLDLPGVSRGGTFETYAQAPNRILSVMQAHPVGTIKIGYDGRKGWALTSSGVRVLKNTELFAVLREADFYGPLNLKSTYKKVTLAGTSKIGYRDVYVLDLQPPTGTADRLYLDAKTYLPVRMNTLETVGSFSGAVETYLDDWREVDGIKFPFSISQSLPKMSFNFTVKEIKHNVPIDAKIFQP
ncbi:MAG TPA: hypothetical protein VJ656_10790, partial [Pyrinomonadaceae bacterium]|nr:hypothetical protein [Pyrinomonadaceae bacterium]